MLWAWLKTPAPTERPPGLLPPASTRETLPADLLESSARRLGIAALVMAAMFAAILVIVNFLRPFLGVEFPPGAPWPQPGNGLALLAIAASLALYAVARHGGLPPRLLLDLGLVHLVFLALIVGVVGQWAAIHVPARLTWISLLIVVYPVLVPNRAWKVLVAALLAASMDPLGAWLTSLRGVEQPPVGEIALIYAPNYLSAALAVIVTRVIRKLGRQVQEARELGSYRLGEKLGSGGMGEVWRAEHRMLTRAAAIKIIRPEAVAGSGEGPEGMRQRFRREAEAVARLRSPHTVELYDVGVTPEGAPYIVMELLDGIDLEALVERFGPLPPERVVHVLGQACHSLAEAHARGLVHRDVKPANLQLCRMGLEVDFLKVLDFGLVKPTAPLVEGDVRATAPHTMVGTPAYMSPETALGKGVDHRSDLYSLGCVAYWLLTGVLVFDYETAMEVVLAHAREEPAPPSRLSEVPIPGEIDALVLELLRKDPGERVPDAGEVARRLEALESVVASPWTRDRARRWWDLHLPEAAAEPVPGPARPPTPSSGS